MTAIKNADFCLNLKGMYYDLDCIFLLFIFVYLCIILLFVIYHSPSLSTDVVKHALQKYTVNS